MKNPAVDQSAAIDINPVVISDQECFNAFRNQIKAAGLPFEDLDKDKHLLIGYYRNDELVGTGGMEVYGEHGLIRSVSVSPQHRGKKLGLKIALHLIAKAKESELKGLYLLTETAKDFFLKIGFEVIDREQAPSDVKKSTEFLHVCPASAVCMHLPLPECC